MPTKLNWNPLTEAVQLSDVVVASNIKPQLIFKHSTRCSVSDMALRRLKDAQRELTKAADLHYVDVIAHRPVSNAIAERFRVVHESPQVLVIFAGECVLEQSHMGVRADELSDVLRTLTPA